MHMSRGSTEHRGTCGAGSHRSLPAPLPLPLELVLPLTLLLLAALLYLALLFLHPFRAFPAPLATATMPAGTGGDPS